MNSLLSLSSGSRLARLAASLVFGGTLLLSQGSGTGIIERLNTDSQAEAVACGRSGAACAKTPYQLCPTDSSPYSAWLATPFSRVASGVFEAMQRGQRPHTMSPGEANHWGLGIYVSPVDDYRRTGDIRRVLIRRADRAIEPITSTLAPVTISLPDGLTKEVSKGYFAFPFDAFVPDSDLTVVLIGTSGETSCMVSRDRLRALR
jgi:hypothetical protein